MQNATRNISNESRGPSHWELTILK
jgi:hypothetical protein